MLSFKDAREAREALKLSQSRVAQKVGINRTYLSLFEVGKYVLDDDVQSTLRSFYEEQGYDFRSQSPLSTDKKPTVAKAYVPAASTVEDTRVKAAQSALVDLKGVAADTGIDSKRTAAAVVFCREANSQLDYPELLSVGRNLQIDLADLPTEAQFQTYPVGEKELWEARAVAVLICNSLYGKHWTDCDWETWREVGISLVRERLLAENDRPKRTLDEFFGGSEGERQYMHRVRSSIAPAFVRAAEQRRALKLTSMQRSPGGFGALW